MGYFILFINSILYVQREGYFDSEELFGGRQKR